MVTPSASVCSVRGAASVGRRSCPERTLFSLSARWSDGPKTSAAAELSLTLLDTDRNVEREVLAGGREAAAGAASAQIKRVHRHEGASPGGRARGGGASDGQSRTGVLIPHFGGRRYVGGCCREWGEDDDDVG